MTGSLQTSDILVVVDKGDNYIVQINPPTLITKATNDTYYRVADYATTASYVSGAVISWDGLVGKPSGLVSSSTQINTGSFSGSFTGLLLGTSSYALTASYALNATIDTGFFATTASNIFVGNQIISGGLNINNNGYVWTFDNAGILIAPSTILSPSFSGSFTGSLLGTASWASTAISASYATTASAATSITFTPQSSSYAISASYTQTASKAISSSFATTASAATSITFTPTTASFATTASAATSITFIPSTASFSITASYVSGATSDWNSLLNKPNGLVSSSTQINTGSFSGSFIGTLIGTGSWASNAITASFAISSSRTVTASFAITASSVLGTVLSASYANNADLLDGLNSTVFATTGSNTFVGNQIITGSLLTNADTLIFTGSIFTSGSLSVVAGTITGSLFGTASYALSASYIDGGFY